MSRIKDILKSIKPEKASNFRVVLLCIFAATIFKFFNSLNGDYSTTLSYPLEFVYDETQYIPIDQLPENVQLNVNGMGWNLFRNSLGIKVTPVKIPLERPTELKRIPGALIPGFISDQLSEFELNYVLTDTLFVNLDYRDSKLYHIKVDSSNISLENNYRIVGPVLCSPDTVRLSGPVSMLAEIPDTVIIKLPDSDIDGNYDDDVVINIPNSQLIKRNPATVNVIFKVREHTRIKREVAIDTLNFPSSVSFLPNNITANVSFDVQVNNQSKVDLEKFKIVFDYKKMDPIDSTIVTELISFPDEIFNVQMDSVSVKVIPDE